MAMSLTTTSGGLDSIAVTASAADDAIRARAPASSSFPEQLRASDRRRWGRRRQYAGAARRRDFRADDACTAAGARRMRPPRPGLRPHLPPRADDRARRPETEPALTPGSTRTA
jgi:hypothetical protein